MTEYKVILFYKFTLIKNPEQLRKEQLALAESFGLKGRMIIGEEGVNATFEGLLEDIEAYKKTIWSDYRFADMPIKESAGNGQAFPKLSVKVREEVVTLGAGKLDPAKDTAPTVSADELENWYESGQDFVVLDLRNDYEVKSGYFDKTINPELENFRDLPQKLKDLSGLKDKKVLTVCTGGIRCEKATCLLKQEGFQDVYQLKDGIHTYMQKYPGRHFKGTLYVFDNRITTPVVDVPNREIVGKCAYCDKSTENYANDDSVRPSKKILCCTDCYEERKDELRTIVSV